MNVKVLAPSSYPGVKLTYLVNVDRRKHIDAWPVFVWVSQSFNPIFPSHWRQVYNRHDVRIRALRKLRREGK